MDNGAVNRKNKKVTSPAEKIEIGSGNVFADLGLSNADEALAKAVLANQICESITERKLTQTQAAALLGIDQPKVSALIRGKLNGFSTERLFRFLNALGKDVEIIVKPRRRFADRASTRVVCS